jgi:hypothetical protein
MLEEFSKGKVLKVKTQKKKHRKKKEQPTNNEDSFDGMPDDEEGARFEDPEE